MAVAQSRRAKITVGPTAHVETPALLRGVQLHRKSHGPKDDQGYDPERGPECDKYGNIFRPRQRPMTRDSEIDEHRRGPAYVQQVCFQEEELELLGSLPRHTRPARPARR